MGDKTCYSIAKSIGGQAVIEGVMMRGKSMYALAVRNIQTNEIIIEKENLANIGNRFKILKFPFIRGVVSFLDSMIIGMKIIMKSAILSGIDQAYPEEKKGKIDIWLEKKFADKLTDYIIYFSVVVSILLSIGIFMVLPAIISSFFSKTIGIKTWSVAIIEGIIRIGIFLAYILLISKINDVQRLFMYHGAEHKTITCFETGDNLTIENVRKHSRLHKRCGTSFLIIVMLVSIIIFIFLPTTNIWFKIISRIILVPFIAGVSYEIIRWAGKSDNFIVKLISAPGIALQKITTKEPTDDMIEVAIKSLQGVLQNDEKLKEKVQDSKDV